MKNNEVCLVKSFIITAAVSLAFAVSACSSESVIFKTEGGDGDAETSEETTAEQIDETEDVSETTESADETDAAEQNETIEEFAEVETESPVESESEAVEQIEETPVETAEEFPETTEVAEETTEETAEETAEVEQSEPGAEIESEAEANRSVLRGKVYMNSERIGHQSFMYAVVAVFDKEPFHDEAEPVAFIQLKPQDFACDLGTKVCEGEYYSDSLPAGNYFVLGGVYFTTTGQIPDDLYFPPESPFYLAEDGQTEIINIYLGVQNPALGGFAGDVYIDPALLISGSPVAYYIAVIQADSYPPYPEMSAKNYLVINFSDCEAGGKCPFKMLNAALGRWYLIALLLIEGQEAPKDYAGAGPFTVEAGKTEEGVEIFLGVDDPSLGSVSGKLSMVNPPPAGDLIGAIAANQWPPPSWGTSWIESYKTYQSDGSQKSVDYKVGGLKTGEYSIVGFLSAPGQQGWYSMSLYGKKINVDLNGAKDVSGVDFIIFNGRIYGDISMYDEVHETVGSVIVIIQGIDVTTNPPSIISGGTAKVRMTPVNSPHKYAASYSLDVGAPEFTHYLSVCLDLDDDGECRTPDNGGQDQLYPAATVNPKTFLFPKDAASYKFDFSVDAHWE